MKRSFLLRAAMGLGLGVGMGMAAGIGPARAADPPDASADAPGDAYAACMAEARRHPDDALKQAEAMWKSGARAASRHCVATALLNMGRAAQAAKVLDDLARDVEGAPDDQRAELAAQAGRAWLDAGDADKAAAAFGRALAAKPDDAGLLVARAVALGAAGKPFEALDDLNRVVEIAPNRADARVLRASAYRRVDAPELAQEDLEAALRLDPQSADGWLEMGLLRESQGDPAGARVALEKAVRLDGDGAAGKAARAVLDRLPR